MNSSNTLNVSVGGSVDLPARPLTWQAYPKVGGFGRRNFGDYTVLDLVPRTLQLTYTRTFEC